MHHAITGYASNHLEFRTYTDVTILNIKFKFQKSVHRNVSYHRLNLRDDIKKKNFTNSSRQIINNEKKRTKNKSII